MNDGRYSTFIDMKKMKENSLICDEKALIHQRQLDEICRIIKERMEYGEYNPSQKIKSENGSEDGYRSIRHRCHPSPSGSQRTCRKVDGEEQTPRYR